MDNNPTTIPNVEGIEQIENHNDLVSHTKDLQIIRTIRCHSHTKAAGSEQTTSK